MRPELALFNFFQPEELFGIEVRPVHSKEQARQVLEQSFWQLGEGFSDLAIMGNTKAKLHRLCVIHLLWCTSQTYLHAFVSLDCGFVHI